MFHAAAGGRELAASKPRLVLEGGDASQDMALAIDVVAGGMFHCNALAYHDLIRLWTTLTSCSISSLAIQKPSPMVKRPPTEQLPITHDDDGDDGDGRNI